MSVIEQRPEDVSAKPGAVLRRAREGAGLTLDAVSQGTMIPVSRLRALENDDYERVGVATFVIGYIRSYARFLGVDAAPLVQNLEPSLPKVEPVPLENPSVALALQVQKQPRSVFWPIVLAVVVILVVVAFIGINTNALKPEAVEAPAMAVETAPQGEGDTVLNLPLNVVDSPVEESAAPIELEPLEGMDTEVFVDSDFAVTGSSSDTGTSAAVPARAAEPPASPVAAPSGSAAETGGPLDQLAFTFTDDCWISVTDATGKPLIARLATSGDNLRLFGRAPFEVVLGNAAAVQLSVNGKAIDSAPLPGRKARRMTVGG